MPIPDTAGPQDFAPAIQAAGAQDAQVFIPLVTIQGCIGTYDALKQLGITTPVVTTGLCFGTPMTEHLKQAGDKGELPDGWYFGGYGYSYFIPGNPAAGQLHLGHPGLRQGQGHQGHRVHRLRRPDVSATPSRS